MADTTHLERMGRELKCPICLSLLNSAVSLTCNHVFCNSCIEKSMKSASNCPVCKIPYRRREIRPVPHMDTLVGIYKSMEIASGITIHVTQAAPPHKSSDEGNQVDGYKIHDQTETSEYCTKTLDCRNQEPPKGLRRESKTSCKRSRSNTLKPCFQTNKRVQVPQYPPSETPTRPVSLAGGEITKDIRKKNSPSMKEKQVLGDKRDTSFAPFFWLRDEEDVEKTSQQTDGDSVAGTPLTAPCFSDIKDSDDEPENTGTTSKDADCFDSEMFDWTQRPCSPELCPSPMKEQVEDSDGQGGDERNEYAPVFNRTDHIQEPDIGNTKCMVSEKGGCIKGLHNSTSPRINCSRSKGGIDTSKKKVRKVDGISQNKRAKKVVAKVLRLHNDMQEAGEAMQTKDADNSLNLIQRSYKRKKKVEFDICDVSAKTRKLSALAAGSKSTSPGDKGIGDDLLVNEKEGRESSSTIKRSCIRNTRSFLKQQNNGDGDMSRASVNAKNRNKRSQSNEVSAISSLDEASLDNDKDGSKVGSINRNCEVSLTKSKSNNNIKCVKTAKDSKVDTCKSNLGKTQHTQEKMKAENQKAGNEDDFDIRYSHDLTLEKVISPTNDAVPRKFKSEKILCAFCQSSEETEASGVMVHYQKGKPVADYYKKETNIIHAHKNCTEWAPNVYFKEDIAVNLEAELSRSRRIKCCCCGLKGAALGCYHKNCRKSFHVPCAKWTPECRWDNDNFVMLCPLHASCQVLPCELSASQLKCTLKPIRERQSRLHQPHANVGPENNMSMPWSTSSRKLVLCCSALSAAEKGTVHEFEHLSRVTVSKNWDSGVTHVIASVDENGACRRTLKYLMGVLEGKWILSIEWIKACMNARKLVPELTYEINVDVHGIRDGPRLGRLRVSDKQPKLFSGYEFYFIGDFVPSYKGYLHDLVVAAGGAILQRKPVIGHQEIPSSGCSTSKTLIVYSLEVPEKCDPSKRRLVLGRRKSDAEALASLTGALAVSNSWLLNSIAGCTLQPFHNNGIA